MCWKDDVMRVGGSILCWHDVFVMCAEVGRGCLGWSCDVSGSATEGGPKRERRSCRRRGDVELWCVCGVRGGGEGAVWGGRATWVSLLPEVV